MKKFMSLCLCIGILFSLSACRKETTTITYKEDEVVKNAEAIIQELNEEKYQDILDKGNDQLKQALSVEQLKEGVDTYVKPLGSFVKHDQHEVTTNDGYIVAGFITTYEKGNIQYVMSFDKDDKLAGIRLAPAQ